MKNWKIKFEAPVGQRVLRRRAFGITTFGGEKPLWWNGKVWTSNPTGLCSTHADCGSYKAFLRHLKKHDKELSGYEIILVSRFIGHDIFAIKEQCP